MKTDNESPIDEGLEPIMRFLKRNQKEAAELITINTKGVGHALRDMFWSAGIQVNSFHPVERRKK